jgi:hypothetical protein
MYYWYYGTLAMHQLGGQGWDRHTDRSRRVSGVIVLLHRREPASRSSTGAWESSLI